MKKFTIIFAIIFSFTFAAAQTYNDNLDAVYLNSGLSEEVEINDFLSENDKILRTPHFNIRLAIKQAKQEESIIYYESNLHSLQLEKVTYFKLLRKAANRSEDVTSFYDQFTSYFPELQNTLLLGDSLSELYKTVRKDTFNGRLDALPSVL